MGKIGPSAVEFADRIFRENIPYSGSIELTHRCNLACRHCYQVAPREGELGAAEWIEVLEDLASGGCLFLSFTGGEPLLRDDLPRLVDAAAGMGYALTIQTNATLVDAPFARMLGSLPTLRADVSVYGADPATHDWFTGVAGSFEATLRGMRLLSENGVPLLLKVTVGNFNLDEVEDIAQLAGDLGARAIFSSLIFPRNDRDPSPTAQRLDDEGLERFIRFESAYVLDILGGLLGGEAKDLTGEDLVRYLNKCAVDADPTRGGKRQYCGGGRTVFAINPYGDVYPCVAFPLVVGNVTKENFSSIWKDSLELERLREREDELPRECAACEMVAECGICRALSYLEAGDDMEISRERCRQTRAQLRVLRHEGTKRR